MIRVLIVGGYGNFGSFIAKSLAQDEEIELVIAGRSIEKARQMADSLAVRHIVHAVQVDIHHNFQETLRTIKPNIVIHTSGPFQGQGYDVALACIAQGCHYIDLADGRDFVTGISALDSAAKAKNLVIVSGASSVPCLTAAIVDHFRPQFQKLESLDYGIATAQKTNRGLATTAAILGYVGRSFLSLRDGRFVKIYGWQGLHGRKYGGLGRRLLSYCDIPDLSLFPLRYPELKTIRFYAGIEVPFIHAGLWALSWLVRWGMIKDLAKFAPALLRLSRLFDRFGTDQSGFHMVLSGVGQGGDRKIIRFELVARAGDGPNIPCVPSILLAKKLARGQVNQAGAFPCVDLINLDEYLAALRPLQIEWFED